MVGVAAKLAPCNDWDETQPMMPEMITLPPVRKATFQEIPDSQVPFEMEEPDNEKDSVEEVQHPCMVIKSLWDILKRV